MTVILENHRQALKVRIMLWASFLACAGALYGAQTLFETYGLNPGDGGVLRPLGERLAVAGLVAALGLSFAGGMAVFASRYAVRLTREGDRVDIRTMTPWGTRRHRLAVADFRGGAYFHGRQRNPRGPSVDAPWITLRVAGRRLPFIVDLQAETVNKGALGALARGAVADWRTDRS